MIGVVKWFNEVKAFGFIVPDAGGKDVFVHASALKKHNVNALKEGDRVSYEIASGKKGPQAVDVRLLG